MRSLNRKYRGRDYPTDVLAFPMERMGKQTEVFLGDVVVCLPVAIGQASRFGNSADQEILRLLIHGTLHLLGYDHEQSPREATRMQRKERAILQTLSPVPPLLASIG
jgi:rRNA maturation RNase YbeY